MTVTVYHNAVGNGPGRVSLQPTNALNKGNFQARIIIIIIIIVIIISLYDYIFAGPGVSATHQRGQGGQLPGPYYYWHII